MTGAGPHARQSSRWAVLEEKLSGAVVLRGRISFCTLYMLPVKVTELSALAGCTHGGGVGVVQIPDAEVAVL